MSPTPKKPSADEELDWLDTDDGAQPPEDAWPEDAQGESEEGWEDEAEDDPFPSVLDDEAESPEGEDLAFFEKQLDPIVVGHREHVSLPDHGLHLILARFSTDSESSFFYADIHQAVANQITLRLEQVEIALPSVQEGDSLMVPVRIALGDRVFEGNVKLLATAGPPHFVLGRDLIAGQVLVDPSLDWVQSKR